MKRRKKARRKRASARAKPKPKPFTVRFSARDAKRLKQAARVNLKTPTAFVKLSVQQAIAGTAIVARAVLAPARATKQLSNETLAALIREVAARPETEKFHDDRAYIASVWDHMPATTIPSLAAFKSKLIELHRLALLTITRADLVGAMNRDLVHESETRFQHATFHFIALDR